jgi:hypothetical protein
MQKTIYAVLLGEQKLNHTKQEVEYVAHIHSIYDDEQKTIDIATEILDDSGLSTFDVGAIVNEIEDFDNNVEYDTLKFISLRSFEINESLLSVDTLYPTLVIDADIGMDMDIFNIDTNLENAKLISNRYFSSVNAEPEHIVFIQTFENNLVRLYEVALEI